jgi:hypothetical protein
MITIPNIAVIYQADNQRPPSAHRLRRGFPWLFSYVELMKYSVHSAIFPSLIRKTATT